MPPKSHTPRLARCKAEISDGFVRIHRNHLTDLFPRRQFELSAQTSLAIKGQSVTLGEVMSALINHDEKWLRDWFDERGQLEVGAFLYQALFGKQPPHEITDAAPWCELILHTDDEFLARLPWNLLNHGGVFLAMASWSIALGAAGAEVDCELSPSPKLLVVAPQPLKLEDTQAQAHLDGLQSRLSAADASYNDEGGFRVVRTWKGFLDALEDYQPDLLYYYGHGTGDAHRSRLAFADEKGTLLEKPMAELALALRNRLHRSLCAAYINCCQGDTGGMLGAGRQLVDTVPVVLTNRTTAFVNAARAQAISFWDDLIVQGVSPLQALRNLYARIDKHDVSLQDYRWMTPVLHCRYSEWRASPITRLSREERDPNWKLKLDRISQWSLVYNLTEQMIRENKPKAYVYIWFGAPNQGLDTFHERLHQELQERLKDVELYPVPPEWPEELYTSSSSFTDMYIQAFKVHDLVEIPGKIRRFSSQRKGLSTLVYIRHTPVLKRAIFKPEYLPTYLEWLSKKFIPRLPENSHALIGISFATPNPAVLHKYLTETLQLNKREFKDMEIEILDELGKVTLYDLRKFIRTHNIFVPQDLQDSIFNDLLAKTDGSYEQIIEEMKHLESRKFRESSAQQHVDDHGSDDGME